MVELNQTFFGALTDWRDEMKRKLLSMVSSDVAKSTTGDGNYGGEGAKTH